MKLLLMMLLGTVVLIQNGCSRIEPHENEQNSCSCPLNPDQIQGAQHVDDIGVVAQKISAMILAESGNVFASSRDVCTQIRQNPDYRKRSECLRVFAEYLLRIDFRENITGSDYRLASRRLQTVRNLISLVQGHIEEDDDWFRMQIALVGRLRHEITAMKIVLQRQYVPPLGLHVSPEAYNKYLSDTTSLAVQELEERFWREYQSNDPRFASIRSMIENCLCRGMRTIEQIRADRHRDTKSVR